jgi:hypothetical protein
VALVFVLRAVPHWWVLPIGGVIIGYIVNYLGIHMIFEPVFPKRSDPLRFKASSSNASRK